MFEILTLGKIFFGVTSNAITFKYIKHFIYIIYTGIPDAPLSPFDPRVPGDPLKKIYNEIVAGRKALFTSKLTH